MKSTFTRYHLLAILFCLFCSSALAQDASVTHIYTLGKIPVSYGANHVVRARVVNTGTTTLTSLNVTLDITGANSFTNVQTIPSLAPGGATTISFAAFSPTATGTNVVTVSVPADANNTNNSKTWNQQVTTNLYAYKEPTLPNATNGVGFNGSTGDFVAKFNADAPGSINEVKVDFTTTGLPYQIGIWDATGPGGAPGTNLWTSATMNTAVGTAFIPVSPAVSVSGGFYVGVRQTGTTNVGFAYQTENPMRSGTFYYAAPLGSTSWVDFGSAPTTLTFRLSIEAQLYIPQPPNCAINLLPATGANVCPTSVTNLSWASGGGGPTSYNVYFGTTNPPPFIGNQTGTTYAPGALSSNTTYYWQVVPENADGPAVGCGVQSFTVGSFYNCYCSPVAGGGTGSMIDQLQFGTINNNTAATNPTASPFYSFQSATTNLVAGFQTPLSITIDPPGTYTGAIASIWIDYDQNGVFDASEWQQIGTNIPGGTTATVNISIPATAALGTTGMRIRSRGAGNANGAADACSNMGSGETEDYLVTIVAPQPCGASIAAGTASGPAMICAGTTFNLAATGYTQATGTTFQWESSPAGAGSWTAISGATDPTYQVTGGITAATDYHLIITCANGGNTDVSNTVSVGIETFYNCYCASAATSTADEEIYSVTLNGTNSNTFSGQGNGCTQAAPGPGSILNRYSNFKTVGTFTQLMQGSTVSFTIEQNECDGATYYSNGATIFIDWDQNGSFSDPGEQVFVESSVSQGPRNITGTITVPATATVGVTGMRVIVAENVSGSGLTPCLSYSFGETEDYLIEVIPVVSCSGNPAAVTASGPGPVCAGAGFTLNASGFSVGSGISYQWEQYDPGSSTWSPIPNATTASYVAAAGVSTATDFRFVTTCANGGGQDVSNVVTVSIAPFYNCYCSSMPAYAGDEEIYSVTLNGNNSNVLSGQGNGCSVAAPGPGSILSRYSNFMTLGPLATIMQGATASFVVEENECDGATYYAFGTAIWVDWNQNGSFADPGEQVFVEPSTATGPRNVAGSFLVPATATPGQTAMRITVAEGYAGSTLTPCLAYFYGETEDYLIEVTAATPCSGTPAVATISGPSSVCAGTSFNLDANGFTVGTGIVYQWLSFNTVTNTWDPITGATNPSYAVTGGISGATDYRFETVCANGGGVSQSATFSVAVSPFYNCYCTPVNGGGSGSMMNEVSIGTITNNTSTSNPVASPFYSSFALSTNLAQGSSVPLNVSIDAPGTYSGAIVSVWIDYNQNGVFEATEWQQVSTNIPGGSTGTVNVNVPITATLGTTGMRLRSRGAGNPNGAGDACSVMGSGETEDYLVTIVPPAACQQPGGLAVANVGTGSADASWTAVTGAVGYEFDITNSPTPPASGNPVTGTSYTAVPYSPGSQIYYLHVRTDCGAGGFSSWSTLSFMPNNNAPGATQLTVNAGCTTAGFTNAGATQGAGEPYPSCNNASTGLYTVWFSFVANSPAVRVSTDFPVGGTLTDSKIGLFSATNVNDYTTFSLISCDEDGGSVVGSGYMSVMYATGLTPGNTYYIQVDGYDASSFGTFCIAVDDLSPAMIASGATTCAASNLQIPEMNTPTYTGWVPLLDESSRLVALVRNPAGGAGVNYNFNGTTEISGVTINTGAVRTANNQPYLDRNYLLNHNGSVGNVDVQFFFPNSELTALSSASVSTGGSPLSLSDIHVTRQIGTTCQPSFSIANGTATVLLQNGNGSQNGVNWIQVTTPGFSNFYLHGGFWVLDIKLDKISAVNVGARNRVDWSTAAEERGDAFEVERSLDGANFTKIGTVAARGSASGYSFWDNAAAPGKNYYRLKMTTPSGEFSYSEVVNATVKNANAFGMEAFPNPVTNNTVTVNVYGTAGVNALISVTDVTGKVIKMIDVKNNTATIDMTGLAAGVYLIKYSDDRHSQTIKVDKQ